MIDLLKTERIPMSGIKETLELIGTITADFIARNEIGSVVLVDTSARNARLPMQKALAALYPELHVDFYYINPAGLVDSSAYEEVYDNPNILQDLQASRHDTGLAPSDTSIDDLIRNLGLDITYALIMQAKVQIGEINDGYGINAGQLSRDLNDRFSKLKKMSANSDNPNVLIYDQCSHNGLCLRVCKTALEKAFPEHNFYTGVTEFEEGLADFRPDLIALPPDQFHPIGCRFFGKYSNGSTIGKLATDPKKINGRGAPSTDGAMLRRLTSAMCEEILKD